MTKLTNFLSAFAVALSVWLALLNFKTEPDTSARKVLLASPLVFVLLFGIYAGSVVLYRTLTFNECKQAADELQKEILEARKSLEKAGFKLSRK